MQSLTHHNHLKGTILILRSWSTYKTKRKPWTWNQRNHEQRLICSSFFNGSMSTCALDMDPTLNMCILVGVSLGGGVKEWSTDHTDPKSGAQIAQITLIQRVEHRLHSSKKWSTDSTDRTDRVHDLCMCLLFLKDFELFMFLCLHIYRIRNQPYLWRFHFCRSVAETKCCKLTSRACQLRGLNSHKVLTKDWNWHRVTGQHMFFMHFKASFSGVIDVVELNVLFSFDKCLDY